MRNAEELPELLLDEVGAVLRPAEDTCDSS